MKLSTRLSTIQDLVPHGIAADVGSDHGKLIISLLQNGIILKGYAIENKKEPYLRTSQAIKDAGLENNIKAMFSDGISELADDVDVVIIAGMGGYLIIDILKKHIDKLKNVKSIIVDAHNAIDNVRKEIVNLGYFIKDERIVVEEGIYYEIIRFDVGKGSSLNDLDYEFGPLLRKEKSEIFINKYQSQISELKNLLLNDNLPEKRKIEIEKQIKKLESIL